MYDPFEEISRMHEDMDKLFNRIFRPELSIGYEGEKGLQKYRTPISGIREKGNQVIATFELPGADKKDIELNINEDSIEVRAEKKEEKEDEKKGQYSYISKISSYYRKVPLPKGLDTDKAKASYKDGILKIEIPKAKQLSDKSKRLQIE